MRGFGGPQRAGDTCSPQIRGGLAGHRQRGKTMKLSVVGLVRQTGQLS
jgi:hypothetical protein